MILSNNNIKWISSLLFGCGGRAKLGPLRRGNLHHLMFVYHWIIIGLTCRSHGPSVDSLFSIVWNKVTKEWGEIFEELAKEGRSISWKRRCLNVVFTSSELNLLALLQKLPDFDLERNSYKQIIKIRLLKLVSLIFLSNFYFSPNDSPSKTMKNVWRGCSKINLKVYDVITV